VLKSSRYFELKPEKQLPEDAVERRRIDVVPYKKRWAEYFELEKMRLSRIFTQPNTVFHHIGSTSIVHGYAKPIIDILIEVEDIRSVDDLNSLMSACSYQAMGELGIPGRRYFRKGQPQHTHHIHVFECETDHIIRHLAFRDYLNQFPEKAREYGKLKYALASKDPYDLDGYISGKHDLVVQLEKESLLWHAEKKKS
jgi:GrpB-like predicted nucleotidyltransferase (UPF0157 family)